MAPSPIVQWAVKAVIGSLRSAEACATEPRNDVLLAEREQVAYQLQPLLAGGFVKILPVEHGGLKRRLVEGIGNFVAVFS